MARGGWVYIGGRAGNKPPAGEKSVITTACEKFIADVLNPRFLPKIRPTKFNYPIAIYGKWHGNKYRFITRYRSDDPTRISRNSRHRSHALNTMPGPPAYGRMALHLSTRLARGSLGAARNHAAFSAVLTGLQA